MMISNRAYDILKWIALIALDALGVCYKTLASIWGWPCGDEVLATCTAVSLCIGALLGISTAQYYKDKPVDADVDYKAGYFNLLDELEEYRKVDDNGED